MIVAFIGIGSMGWPMAANVLKAGHDLIVYDATPGRATHFVAEHGGRAAEYLKEVASAELLVTMLPNGQVVRDVYLQEGLADLLSPRAIAIDMSSSDPTGTRALGAALAAKGITLIDAPVSGDMPGANAATLAIMIGSDDLKATARAKVLLASMGMQLFETGGLGSGHAMKALNNFVAAAGYAAAAEALLAGKRFGLDPARMLEILNVSSGRNFNTEVIFKPHVVDGRFASGFPLGLLAQDVAIAADMATALNLAAPVARLVNARYQSALAELGFARDNTEAILAWDKDMSTI